MKHIKNLQGKTYKVKLTSLMLALALNLASCDYSEDALLPSGDLTSNQLPQGNHDYDQRIVDFNKKYGTCLLYKFTDKEAYWSPTGWNMFQYNETNPAYTLAGLACKPANENYVGKQIDLLNEVWFSKFNDKFLKDFLPLNILLCDQHDSCYVTIKWDTSVTPMAQIPTINAKAVPAWSNYNNITVGYGNEKIEAITDKQKTQMQTRIFHLWPEYFCKHGCTPTEEFSNAITYGKFDKSSSYLKDCNAYGILTSTYNASPASDWQQFIIMMINYPESYLNDATAVLGPYDSFTPTGEAKCFKGILTPVKDVNGLYLKRYKMVRQYFIDNYGMDLQIVGNSR